MSKKIGGIELYDVRQVEAALEVASDEIRIPSLHLAQSLLDLCEKVGIEGLTLGYLDDLSKESVDLYDESLVSNDEYVKRVKKLGLSIFDGKIQDNLDDLDLSSPIVPSAIVSEILPLNRERADVQTELGSARSSEILEPKSSTESDAVSKKPATLSEDSSSIESDSAINTEERVSPLAKAILIFSVISYVLSELGLLTILSLGLSSYGLMIRHRLSKKSTPFIIIGFIVSIIAFFLYLEFYGHVPSRSKW